MENHRVLLWKILAAVSYAAMIAVNVLATTLPINGLTTQQISDSYPNLFTPAGYTFAIWGAVYLLLLAYILFQAGLFRGKGSVNEHLLQKTRVWFVISSLANITWIFAWHYKVIPISLICTIGMLISLMVLARSCARDAHTVREAWLVRLPFAVYFGWITVATAANATVWLVSMGWAGFGASPAAWTIALLLAILLIASATLFTLRDIAFGAVILWAYGGILVRHVSNSGFQGAHPVIIWTIVVCMALTALDIGVLLVSRKRIA